MSKKLLIISNNALSNTQHNGKTLTSFFRGYPAEKIAQLYFNPALPDYTEFHNYYRITDYDVLAAIIHNSSQCGTNVEPGNYTGIRCERTLKYKTHFVRWARDIMWKSGKWKNERLKRWVQEVSPEVVFFLAGDSGFAYDICKYIVEKYNPKLVVYITDDYFMPRYEVSPFFWIRRRYLALKAKELIMRSDLFITISVQMRDEYERRFGKKSIQAFNMTEELYEPGDKCCNDIISLVYTGGLHYNRWKVLQALAEAISEYNRKATKRAFLRVYSTQLPSSKVARYLKIDGASDFCGSLDKESVKRVLNTCDITVHVESFDKNSVASTRLSLSTKIPEYLSLKKPVLAIGPKGIASMAYLADCAYCIEEKNQIKGKAAILLQNKKLQEHYAKLCYEKYQQYTREAEESKRILNALLG